MNSSGATLLTNPHPCGHIVYPYTDEGLVGQAVCLYTTAGLHNDEGVILITSREHSESIKLRLAMEGIDSDSYQRSGQLICVSAEEMLQKFVVDGVVDEGLFKFLVGGLIGQSRATVGAGKVRIFGEMVSQLRGSNLAATTRLEELWSEVVQSHSVSLLCTYALHHEHDQIPESLVGLHTHSVEAG